MKPTQILNRKVSLKTLISVAAVAILLSTVVTYQIVYSNPVSPAIYLDDIPAGVSYVVKKQVGSEYYWAVRSDGEIEFEGANATIVIQNLFNTINGHGKIFFAKGIYAICGIHITIDYTVTDSTQQCLEVCGEGMGETIFRGITTSNGTRSSNASRTENAWFIVEGYDVSGIRFHFHDFQVDGQHDSQTNIVSGIVVYHPRDALIERVLVRRCSRNGIAVCEPNLAYRATTIRNCKVFDINDPDGSPELPAIENCVGINMKMGFADCYIRDNEVGWIGYVDDESPFVGIGIAISDSDIAEQNIIWVVGFGIQTWWDIRDVVIQNNWIDFAYNASILIDHANMTTCQNNILRIPYQYGIYIANSSRCSVQCNKLLLRTGYSMTTFIYEDSDSDYNSISFNNCWNEGTITGEIIHISGVNSTEDHNAGDVA